MLDARGGAGPSDKARAQRFELQIPLRYRAGGEIDWHRGTTRNISRSGVLFQGEDWAEPRSHLELNLRLPRENGVDRSAELACRGTVTRSERGGSDETGHLIAISISHYRLVRSQDGRGASPTAESS